MYRKLAEIARRLGGPGGISIRLVLTVAATSFLYLHLSQHHPQLNDIADDIYELSPATCRAPSNLTHLIACSHHPNNWSLDMRALSKHLLRSPWAGQGLFVAYIVLHICLLLAAPWFWGMHYRHSYRWKIVWVTLGMITFLALIFLFGIMRATPREIWVDKRKADLFLNSQLVLYPILIHYLLLIWSEDWYLTRFLPASILGRWKVELPQDLLNTPRDLLLIKNEQNPHQLYVLDEWPSKLSVHYFLLDRSHRVRHKYTYEDIVARYREDRLARYQNAPTPPQLTEIQALAKLAADTRKRVLYLLLHGRDEDDQRVFQWISLSANEQVVPLTPYPYGQSEETLYDVYFHQKYLYILSGSKSNRQLKVRRFPLKSLIQATSVQHYDISLPESVIDIPDGAEGLAFSVRKSNEIVVRIREGALEKQLSPARQTFHNSDLYTNQYEFASVTARDRCATCVRHEEGSTTSFHIYDESAAKRDRSLKQAAKQQPARSEGRNDDGVEEKNNLVVRSYLTSRPDRVIYWHNDRDHRIEAFTIDASLDQLAVVTRNPKGDFTLYIISKRYLWVPDIRERLRKSWDSLVKGVHFWRRHERG